MKPPKPAPTCENEIQGDDGVWRACGEPWDGLYIDATPCCPRCREIAGIAFTALIDLIVAASTEHAAQRAEKAA